MDVDGWMWCGWMWMDVDGWMWMDGCGWMWMDGCGWMDVVLMDENIQNACF
uniref:Uncharacterized protein n=1 Tax=Physcomitrium patens TaxID=3218 RepID=A0A2K1KNI7_PHYPA|nr:hypothetical protein PHYPA_006233 [Physcomitrium patens]